MDGFEIGTIILGSLLGLLLIVGVIGIIKEKLKTSPDWFDWVSGKLDSTGSYITTWFTLLPYAIFLAGPIVDMITSQYMYTSASLVGMITVIAVAFFGSESVAGFMSNWVPSLKTVDAAGISSWNWTGIGILAIWIVAAGSLIGFPIGFGSPKLRASIPFAGISLLLLLISGTGVLGDITPTVRTLSGDTSTSYAGVTIADVCATPGLGCVQTSFAPVGILLNTSILSCHFFESYVTGDKRSAGLAAGVGGAAFLVELVTQWAKGCTSAYKYGIGSSIISLLLGIASGATAYYTMKNTGLESFTQSSQDEGIFHPPPAPEKAKKSSESSKKIVVGAATDTSEPVDESQDAFVCEAYKDGELITSTIVD